MNNYKLNKYQVINKMIEIAIDGTAASGKGTLARKLSVKYDFPHLLQLIQATVETLCKSLRIATFGCNENQKSL